MLGSYGKVRIIEAAERFTADPFFENSGGLWKDFDRFWESFRRISAGPGRIWQDFGRRSAGSGSPGLIFGRKIADSRGDLVAWPGANVVLTWWLTWRKARGPYLTSYQKNSRLSDFLPS